MNTTNLVPLLTLAGSLLHVIAALVALFER